MTIAIITTVSLIVFEFSQRMWDVFKGLYSTFKRGAHLGFNAIKMLKKISLALLAQRKT